MRMKSLGKGIKAVIGFKKGGGSEVQSFLFPRGSYTLATARAWIKTHNYKVHEVYLVNDIIFKNERMVFIEEIVPETAEEDSLPKVKRPKWWWLLQ
jgi:hypothetical protein